jgi:hypothetical protein
MTARWIWDRYAGYNNVPQGDCYFRNRFYVSTESAIEIWCACDDQFELWLDGEFKFEDKDLPGYIGKPKTATDIRLDVGWHYIAVRGINNNNLQAGLLCSVLAYDVNGYANTVLTETSTSWKQVGYPTTPPGFTPGEIIRILLDEAIDRIPLVMTWTANHIVLMFDDETDSAGNAWPTTSDVAVSVGADLLSVLRQLCETYIDIRAAVGYFGLFAYSSYDNVTSAVLDAQVNITELRHAGEF